MEPIVGGASNVVYALRSTHGHDFVARTTATGSDRYRIETAAMDRVRPLGVPCPEIVGVVAEAGWDVMLTRRLPGRRLSDAAPQLAPRDMQAIADEAGELLAKIHSLAVNGYGNLDASGRGRCRTFDEWFIDEMAREVADVARAGVRPESVAALHEILAVLEESRSTLNSCHGRLAHGDFSPMNILVEGRRITGLVDWESVKSGPAALDFGWWDWFTSAWSTPFPTVAMFAAYRQHVDVDLGALETLRRLVVLRVRAGQLLWAVRRGEAGAIDHAERALGAARDRLRDTE